MALIFDTPRLVLNAYAVLVGQTPGHTAYNEHLGYVSSLTPTGYKAALNDLFKDLTTPQLATIMLTNLGLTKVFTQEIGEEFLGLFSNRIGAMIDLADWVYTYPEDTGPKLAYVSKINASYAYSLTPTNGSSVSLSALASASQSFELSAGRDTLPGTSGDDAFSAIIQNSGTNGTTDSSTLNSADSIDGGAGTDVLNIRLISLTGPTTISPVLTNLEKISLNSEDGSGNNAAIRVANSTVNSTSTLQTVEFKDHGVGANTTFLSVPRATVISLDNADSEDGQKVNFRADTTDSSVGTDFSMTVANGSGSSTKTAGINLVATNGTSDDTSFKSVTITVAGEASYVQAGTALASLTSVTVKGAATGVMTGFGLELSQDTGFNSLKTVSASGMTGGGLQLDARGSTATGFTFTGSSLADALLLSRDTLNASATLNGGLGKDILATTSFSNVSTAVNRAISFEVLEAITPQSSLEASSFTSIHEFLFSGGNGNGLNITGVESNDRFIFSSDHGGRDEGVRFTAANAGASVVFEMRAFAETNGEVTIIANDNNGNDVSAIGFRGGISSVTVDSTGTNTNANLIEAVKNGNYNYFAFNNDNGLANFTITGSQDLTIAAKEGVEMSSSSRLLGFTNSVNVNAASFTGALRIAGSNSADVIVGGSGGDIIYGMGGSDILTGGGGADQFRMVGTRGTDVLKDFVNGTDKIGFNNVNFANTTATPAGATLSASDYVDNRSGITSIGASDNHKVIELQTALSSSQAQTDVGAAVEAYVILFNSTTSKGELWFDANWSDASGRTQVATFDTVTSLVGVTSFTHADFVEFTS
jgi:hypothetical protein